MNVIVILGHPNPASFNHAIAAAVSQELRSLGHVPMVHDLYREAFDPVLTAAELAREVVLPESVERHCRELAAAEGLVIVHPNWWSQPPAIVRGWTDRVLRPGVAYQFVSDGQGGAKPVGLLRLKTALVFNTANTPQQKEEELYGDPLETLWCKVVFGICGVPQVARRSYSPVILSTPEQRGGWLQDVRALVRRCFGPPMA
jgi:putative NADPH-quinone reductase